MFYDVNIACYHHVASAWVPCTTLAPWVLWRNEPPFCLFLKELKSIKIKIKSEKIYKIQKSISLKIELLFDSNFLHWLKNLFLFNIMPSKI